jgi:hypothetical protein
MSSGIWIGISASLASTALPGRDVLVASIARSFTERSPVARVARARSAVARSPTFRSRVTWAM